jgi:hypothetical protein
MGPAGWDSVAAERIAYWQLLLGPQRHVHADHHHCGRQKPEPVAPTALLQEQPQGVVE